MRIISILPYILEPIYLIPTFAILLVFGLTFRTIEWVVNNWLIPSYSKMTCTVIKDGKIIVNKTGYSKAYYGF